VGGSVIEREVSDVRVYRGCEILQLEGGVGKGTRRECH